MNLIVIGCPGIGKTTIASNNNLFIDLKKAEVERILKNYENKIILMNFIGLEPLKSIIDKNNYKILFLDINKEMAPFLKKRLIKRELKKNICCQKILNEINAIDKFLSLVCKDKEVIIKKINNEKELNNLENILLEEYNKLNVKNGRYNRS